MASATRNVRTAISTTHNDILKPLINIYEPTTTKRHIPRRVMVTPTMAKCLASPSTKPNENSERPNFSIAHALLMKLITKISGAMVDGTRNGTVTNAAKMRTLAAMIVNVNMIIATDTPAAISRITCVLSIRKVTMAAVQKMTHTAKLQRFRTEKASTRGICAIIRRRRSGNRKKTRMRRQKLPQTAHKCRSCAARLREFPPQS